MSSDPSYTVFIRLPFARGDFVDPLSVCFPSSWRTIADVQVEWDASKDKALWKILSKASKNSDIDCKYFTHILKTSLKLLGNELLVS